MTKRQTEVLEAIAHYLKSGQAPGTGELLERLHMATVSSLDSVLRPLESKGFIEVHRPGQGKQRTIGLTARGRSLAGLGLPILGAIPAEPLSEAIQRAPEWAEDADSLLCTQPGDFMLRIDGTSMIGAGIMPYDLVLLRPNIEAHSGEIVAAQICDSGFGDQFSGRVESTLKYFDIIEGGSRVRLRAANPAYADREFDAGCVRVAGVFRGLVRKTPT